MSAIRHFFRHFLLALQFFTRVPVTGRLASWVGYSPQMLRASAGHFPGIGWLVGCVAAGVFAGACWALTLAGHSSQASAWVAAVLSTLATVLMTGGFHEDGLADVADGLGGSLQRERALVIMKDSRVGAFGVLALVLVYTPRVARVVRASTLVVRELLFVEAVRALGVRTSRILWRHILPNLMSPILVQVSFIFAYAILAEAGLSFLGVGVPPDIPTWGTMVAGSQQYADRAFWVVLFPGLAIIFTALSLQLLGDGVRDLLDPKLKKAA